MAKQQRPASRDDDGTDTTKWPARKMLEVGLRVAEKFGEDKFPIHLTVAQAKEALVAVSEQQRSGTPFRVLMERALHPAIRKIAGCGDLTCALAASTYDCECSNRVRAIMSHIPAERDSTDQ